MAKKEKHDTPDPPKDELVRIAIALKDGGWTQTEVEKEFRNYHKTLSKKEVKEFVKKIYNPITARQRAWDGFWSPPI